MTEPMYSAKHYAIKAEKSKIAAEDIKDQCQDILNRLGTVIKIKGRVDTVDDLPTENNLDGDCYLVGYVNAGQFQEYYWFSDHWEFLGTAGDTLNWGAIQGTLSNQEDLQAALDSTVHKTGDEVINGKKTFVDGIITRADNINVDVIPAQHIYKPINFNDKNNKRFAAVEASQRSDGNLRMTIQANREIDGAQKYAQVSVEIYPDGTCIGRAPTPPVNSNSDEIVTTVWARNRITDIMNSVLPAGMIIPYVGRGNIPDGWLECNGQEVSRTQYANLFNVIGTNYGSGDDLNTFNLPNMTNRYLMGSNNPGQYIEAGLPNITGTVYHGQVDSTSSNGAFSSARADDYGGTNYGYPRSDFTFDASRVNSIYGKSSTVTPLTITVRYLIKY